MSLINRFSSRRQRLDHAFLSARLRGARSYGRIAGYFRSSIFELVGEEIAAIPQVRDVAGAGASGSYELRESMTAHEAVFGPENDD